jgi:hypothetical protein
MATFCRHRDEATLAKSESACGAGWAAREFDLFPRVIRPAIPGRAFPAAARRMLLKRQLNTARPPSPSSKATAMSAALCELNPAIREFLVSLPPGTVIAQLADGSLAICRSEAEADRLIAASRGAVKGGKSARKSRSLEPSRTSKPPAVKQPSAG